MFRYRSALGIGIPLLSRLSQNKRWVSSATKETSRESGYIVLKCFETLSMVSRETQAFLGNSKERHRGAGLNAQYASTQQFVKAEIQSSLTSDI